MTLRDTESRAEPGANAAPRRPGAPFAEFANDEAATGAQHAGDLLEHRRGVIDEAEYGDRRHDVELPICEREVLRQGHLEADVGILARGPGFRGVGHLCRRIDAHDDRATPLELERELAIAAAHIEHPAIFDVAYELEDQLALEPLGDGAKLRCAPLGIGVGTQVGHGTCGIGGAHLSCRANREAPSCQLSAVEDLLGRRK